MKTLVIIPAYNEEENLFQLIKAINSFEYDYLVINDNSTDNTKKLLEENNFNAFNLPINLGIAGVTRIGFMYAKEHNYDCVICVDGDGQHPPKYIHNLVSKIDEGYDYVVGSRFIEEKKPFSLRMLGSRLICLMIKLKTGKTVTDPTSGMRAIGKSVIHKFAESMNYYAEPDTMCHLIHGGYKVTEVQVYMKDREAGTSYFQNPLKSAYYMLSVILSIVFLQ